MIRMSSSHCLGSRPQRDRDTVYAGQVTPLYSMIPPPGFLGADESFDTMYSAPNVDQAKKYLEASGYSATIQLSLRCGTQPEHYGASTAAWMQPIKTQLEATGEIQVTLTSQEWSTYAPALTGGKSYGAGVLGWFFDYPDPPTILTHSSSIAVKVPTLQSLPPAV